MNNKLIELMTRIVDRRINESTQKREPASVISVDSAYKRAVVEFLSGSRFTLLNKTGEKLAPGDSVWVEYRILPSDGFIAMRNGEADHIGGGVGLILRNGIVVTADQSGVYAQQASSQQAINVTNLENTYYASANDSIVVQGNLTSASKSTPRDGTGEYETWYNYSAYVPVMTDTLILGGHTYTLRLTQTYQDGRRQYNVFDNGVQMQAGNYYSEQHNSLSFNPGTHSFRVGFIPIYSAVYAPDSNHQYGYAQLYNIMICWITGDNYNNGTTGALTDSPSQPSSYNTLLTQEIASQAEYDYAVNLTRHTSLPPSLGE
ncbi:MAG: hypothetical protein IJM87_00200 [Ruminococcus sp.]|nr:hypothetical protein [Ruminococcus sp.]